MFNRFRATWAMPLVGALLIVIVACSGDGKVNGPVLSSPRQPLIGGGGMDAIVGGEVVFDENAACLFLGRGEHQVPVVRPHGAEWQTDPPAVKIQGKSIEPGMSVEGGGGHIPYDSVRQLAGDAVADAALACAGPTGEIAFFNRGSRVDVLSD